MKRFLSLLLVLSLTLAAFPAHAVDYVYTEGADAYGYDFDLFFSLNRDAFPENRNHARGYADLLDILELKGRVITCPEWDSIEMDLSVIPTTNPAAALNFRLDGRSSHILLTTPLLANIPVLFNNEALMEFCQKTYSHLGIPLPWLALLYPYTADWAFWELRKAWNNKIGAVTETCDIPNSKFVNLAMAWQKILQEDTQLTDWFSALSLESDQSEVLQAELASIPSYIRNILTEKGDIHVEFGRGEQTWSNASGPFYRRTDSPLGQAVEARLPATAGGFVPVLTAEKRTGDNRIDTAVHISYIAGEGTGDEETLLNLTASCSLPIRLPVSETYPGEIDLTGSLLPWVRLTWDCTLEESGAIRLVVRQKEEASAGEASPELLVISGTLTEFKPDHIPWLREEDIIYELNIFSINDVTLKEFVGQVLRPAFEGLLPFLVEMPASSCQVIMDDLTEAGVLSVLLGE